MENALLDRYKAKINKMIHLACNDKEKTKINKRENERIIEYIIYILNLNVFFIFSLPK